MPRIRTTTDYPVSEISSASFKPLIQRSAFLKPYMNCRLPMPWIKLSLGRKWMLCPVVIVGMDVSLGSVSWVCVLDLRSAAARISHGSLKGSSQGAGQHFAENVCRERTMLKVDDPKYVRRLSNRAANGVSVGAFVACNEFVLDLGVSVLQETVLHTEPAI